MRLPNQNKMAERVRESCSLQEQQTKQGRYIRRYQKVNECLKFRTGASTAARLLRLEPKGPRRWLFCVCLCVSSKLFLTSQWHSGGGDTARPRYPLVGGAQRRAQLSTLEHKTSGVPLSHHYHHLFHLQRPQQWYSIKWKKKQMPTQINVIAVVHSTPRFAVCVFMVVYVTLRVTFPHEIYFIESSPLMTSLR